MDRLARLQRRDCTAQPHPERLVGIEAHAPAHHRFDMRALGGMRTVEVDRIEAPQACKCRIVQVEPAVAAEYYDAFVERLEGLTLHTDQRLVAPHQLQPF